MSSSCYATFRTESITVARENDVNKILKQHKKDKGQLDLLFVSEWNPYCEALVRKVGILYEDLPSLRIIDSFKTPHAFVIFKVTKTPTLVRLNDSEVTVIDYLPHIYEVLGLE